MALKNIAIQNSMIFQLNQLSSNAHKTLFALLAQVPNPVTGVLRVKVKDLYKTLHPERTRVSRQFKGVLEQSLNELQSYTVQIFLDDKWKGFRKLLSRKLISTDKDQTLNTDDLDTIVCYLDDHEYLLEGTILKAFSVEATHVIVRFNPILLELFTTSEPSYAKINLKEAGSLKKQLSPRLLELLPIFSAIAKHNGHACFEWAWRGESQKIPSVLNAFPSVSAGDLDHLYPDRLEPALQEMVDLGYLKNFTKKLKSPKRIQAIFLEFPLPVEQLDESQRIENDSLPF